MDLVVSGPEREIPSCMPEIQWFRNPLIVLGRLRNLPVLWGRKCRGSRADKKGRRGGRKYNFGEHDRVSCLCCCSRRHGVCRENLVPVQQCECEVPHPETWRRIIRLAHTRWVRRVFDAEVREPGSAMWDLDSAHILRVDEVERASDIIRVANFWHRHLGREGGKCIRGVIPYF